MSNICKECRASCFVFDHVVYDRICTNCGLVSAFELPDTDDCQWYKEQPKYDRAAYFKRVVHKLITKGLKMSNEDVDWMLCKYCQAFASFKDVKHSLNRKSFPPYNLFVYKLCIIRGIDPSPIKLPKMAQTLRRAVEAWDSYKHSVEDFTPNNKRRCVEETDFEPLQLDEGFLSWLLQ